MPEQSVEQIVAGKPATEPVAAPSPKSGVTFYAWTHIKVSHNEEIKPGEVINVDDYSAEELSLWLSEGIIRTEPFPTGVIMGESLKTYQLRKINQMVEEAKTSGRPANSEILGALEQKE